MKQPAGIAILLFFASFLTAQEETLRQLPAVEIPASRLSDFTPADGVMTLDSTERDWFFTNNLAEALAAQKGIFIKNYGPSNIASISLRGMDGSHTAILWNGVNLQNPMNGVMDFSLLPADLFDKISVDDGSGTALSGAASVAGTVFLDNFQKKENGWSGRAGLSAGSYADYSQHAKLHFKNKKWSAGFSANHQAAENDFPLPGNFSGNEKLQNARLEKWNFLQENDFQITENQSFKTFFWYQNADRQIPPPLLVNNDRARQIDDIVRAGMEWKYAGIRHVTKIRAACLHEYLNFSNITIGEAVSRATTFLGEAERDIFLKNDLRGNFGLHFSNQKAGADDLARNPERSKAAAFASFKKEFPVTRLALFTQFRGEWVSDLEVFPLSGLLGATWRWNEHWSLDGRLTRNYKLPTFNDLYWIGSGNPDLLPEKSWNQDLNLNWHKTFGRLTAKTRFSGFSNLVENWIQWLPGTTLWSPINHKKVWARGLTADLEIVRRFRRFQVHFSADYTFSRSTVEKIYAGDTGDFTGKQLIFLPLHQGNFSAGLHLKRTILIYRHNWAGSRFTTTTNDADAQLSGFNVGYLMLGRRFIFDGRTLFCSLKINNLWDAAYQIMENRPMPPRHFAVDAAYRF